MAARSRRSRLGPLALVVVVPALVSRPHHAFLWPCRAPQHQLQQSALGGTLSAPLALALTSSSAWWWAQRHEEEQHMPEAPGRGSGGRVVMWGKRKKQREEELQRLAAMEQQKKTTGGSGGGKKKRKESSAPRPPVFTARIVLLGAPSPAWGADTRDRLLQEGWMEDRVQVLPLPDPKDYSEAKWLAYMREGIKLRNATFVIAASPTAAAQALRFLEKHPLRGAILMGPPSGYDLGGGSGEDAAARPWNYTAVRQHCPFVGLIYPIEGLAEGQDAYEWDPPAEAEAVRDGLGLAPFPFGIRATLCGEEYRAIEALIRDWQFLESLGMGPIQLVGEDDEEEAALAALAALAAKRAAKAGGAGEGGEEAG